MAEQYGGVSEDSDLSTGVYSCPQDGCVHVFQRVSALEKHQSVEKCSRSPEKYSLMDLVKMGFKTHLEEGVGILPSLKAPAAHQEGHFVPNEGWALRAVKKSYRFSEKQKSYLLAKFSFGQTTGRNLDAEVVAREMRRPRGADCVLLLKAKRYIRAKGPKPISGHLKRKVTLVLQRRSLKPFSSTILWYTISTACVRWRSVVT